MIQLKLNRKSKMSQRIFIFFVLLLAMQGNWLSGQETVTQKDSTPFSVVSIGKQVWMVENLNLDKFRNGDAIPEVRTAADWEKAGENKQAAWCYYDFNPLNGEKYGKLYNWYAVTDTRGLAPSGWHVPSDEEWAIMVKHLGGDELAAPKMKSKTGWQENENVSNESGFSALPGGHLQSDGSKFSPIFTSGYWWSTTAYGENYAWMRRMNYYSTYVTREDFYKRSGLSVRCVKD